MAEVGTFYQSKYTGEQLDEILKNVYDAVPLDGSKPMTGALDIKKVENGYSKLNKNHTQTTDLGTELKDISKGGSVVALLLKAADQAARLQFGTSVYDLIHTGNITGYVKPYADAAQAASEAAESALEGVREAIEAIPEGAATPIVNDLTTGGTSMALSAEMGKKLNTEQNKLLPLNGSKPVTGNLTISKSQPNILAKDTNSARAARLIEYPNGQGGIENYKDGSNYRGIRINTEADDLAGALKLAQMLGGVWSEHNIFHTGNKPSGSYTGNGSVAYRAVNVGGIGSVMLIRSSEYGNVVASFYASKLGENPKNFTSAEVSYIDGILHLATDHAAVNKLGVTYYYQVL